MKSNKLWTRCRRMWVHATQYLPSVTTPSSDSHIRLPVVLRHCINGSWCWHWTYVAHFYVMIFDLFCRAWVHNGLQLVLYTQGWDRRNQAHLLPPDPYLHKQNIQTFWGHTDKYLMLSGHLCCCCCCWGFLENIDRSSFQSRRNIIADIMRMYHVSLMSPNCRNLTCDTNVQSNTLFIPMWCFYCPQLVLSWSVVAPIARQTGSTSGQMKRQSLTPAVWTSQRAAGSGNSMMISKYTCR